MYGIEPINGRTMKDARNSTLDDFKSSSFRSDNAFMRNPHERNPMHAKSSEINCPVSLKYRPTAIGRIVKIPAICSKKPRFARTRLRIFARGFLV
jgi:hypothetical protein